jgi:hypothetical protein
LHSDWKSTIENAICRGEPFGIVSEDKTPRRASGKDAIFKRTFFTLHEIKDRVIAAIKSIRINVAILEQSSHAIIYAENRIYGVAELDVQIQSKATCKVRVLAKIDDRPVIIPSAGRRIKS